jgi:thiamine-phosphate pyrophosphorylase
LLDSQFAIRNSQFAIPMLSLNGFPQSPFLYPIFDSVFSKNLLQDAREAIRAGIEIFQIRAKNLTKARLFEIVRQLEPVCEQKNICLIVNDDVDVALVSKASGVHLGQEDFPVFECRRILPDRIIGISTHSKKQFLVALSLPVDYVAIGPVYETSTKISTYSALGTSFIEEVRTLTELPIVCIGGIRKESIADLLKAGADGIAVISELYREPDLYSSLSRLQEAVRR